MPNCLICQTPNLPGATLCGACGSPLDGATSSAGDAQMTTSDVAHALPNGALLQNDAFRVDGVLGQGGFGITYRGRDLRLDREVAIKEFFPFGNAIRIQQDNRLEPSAGLSRGDFEKARANFFEEARTLARFSHPHIVNVFTAFEEKNTAYMVMEFLSGQSLQARIDAKRALREDETLNVIEHVARALEIIHAAGLLHRDLKPDNILLCPDFVGGERAVLVDFGSARTFIAGQTQNFDRLITPGYAPLEQYSSSARFDVYTDIYALGATLYQCLTGQVPPAATDRASGVELTNPRQLNPGLSRAINDATLWALSLNAADRPQSMREFVTSLRSTKDSTGDPARSGNKHRPGSNAPTAPSHRTDNDPRTPRIQTICRQLANAPALPASRYDTALKEANAKLSKATSFRVPPSSECPACHKATLRHITPAVGAANCPLCEGQLAHRHFDLNLCPICREPKLSEHSFSKKDLFCPLCRVAPLKEDHRKKLGLIIDIWLCCPHCKAELDVFTNHTAKLMVAGNDPRGAEFLGQTKPMAEWKTLAARADRVLRCGGCAAQFDAPDDDRVTLVRALKDPHGVAARYFGKTFFRRAWARLAQGMPLGAGNCNCRQCQAEWNYDSQQQTLKLLQCEDKYAAWKNQTHGISQWKFLREGKSSARAGYRCQACATEFDDDGGQLRLVKSLPGALATRGGQKFSFADWHRIAAGVPDSHEEVGLRRDAMRLEHEQQRETSEAREAQSRERQSLEYELDSLARQSFLEGYLEATDPVAWRTQNGEEIRWLSTAVLLKYRTKDNIPYWDNDLQGALMLTKDRFVFLDAPGSEHWTRPLAKMRRVQTTYISGQQMLEVYFDGLKNPLGFLASTMTVDVIIGNNSRRLQFSISDLATWLDTLR